LRGIEAHRTEVEAIGHRAGRERNQRQQQGCEFAPAGQRTRLATRHGFALLDPRRFLPCVEVETGELLHRFQL